MRKTRGIEGYHQKMAANQHPSQPIFSNLPHPSGVYQTHSASSTPHQPQQQPPQASQQQQQPNVIDTDPLVKYQSLLPILKESINVRFI